MLKSKLVKSFMYLNANNPKINFNGNMAIWMELIINNGYNLQAIMYNTSAFEMNFGRYYSACSNLD